jgi:hypothetical protein
MSGGKGGSTTSKVEIPAWLEDAAKRNLGRGEQLAQVGYQPYYGPDVAAVTQPQMAAMQNTSQAAAAFGMGGGDPMQGMPQAQTFANGLQGYSSGGLFDEAQAMHRQQRPGQAAAYDSLFVDPKKASPAAKVAAAPAPAAKPSIPAVSRSSDKKPAYRTQGYRVGDNRRSR